MKRVCVFHVAVPTEATAPFGFADVPALKNDSVKHALSSENEPVPQVKTDANGSINPFEALSISLEVNPLTPK